MDRFVIPVGSSTATVTAAATAPATHDSQTRGALDHKLIVASQRYQQAELIKETIYEAEGMFPGKEFDHVCYACQADSSVCERDKSRRFASKQGLLFHVNSTFHSGYGHWRRLRKQDAAQVLASNREMSNTAAAAAATTTTTTTTTSTSKFVINNNSNSSSKLQPKTLLDQKGTKKAKLTFYCPYPFCRSGGAGWSTLHELVAHVQGSAEDTESLHHEQRKWMEGWADEAWLVNEDADRMVREVERRYPG